MNMKKILPVIQLLVVLTVLHSVVLAQPSVSFSKKYGVVRENGGSISVNLTISASSPVPVSVDVVIVSDFATAIPGTHYTFVNDTYTFPASSTTPIVINIPIIDNGNEAIDRLFILKLVNPVNCVLGSSPDFSGFILDDEETSPVPSKALDIEFASSFQVDPDGSAEIVAYSRVAKRLYVMNSTESKIEILDFSDPRNINSITSVNLQAYGTGGTSVACNDSVVVATVSAANQGNGSAVFMDVDGNVLKVLTVGSLPDMVTFTPDNRAVLIANEGEPASDYSVDPEGTISYIDMTGGVNNLTAGDVTSIGFNAFDGQKASLRAAGVRIFGFNASVSQDFEPEYITVSDDSKKAWVSLQENNALAEIDLMTKTVTKILPLKSKDYSIGRNSLDASDRNDSVFMGKWDLNGMYLPDAIAWYTKNGQHYVITANEGDQREYDQIDEDVQVKSNSYVLDPVKFPNAAILKRDHLLGRLAVSPYTGDTDGDGDIDEIHAFGARSFTIWNTQTGKLVHDSGNDFEKIISKDPKYGKIFNASNDNISFKNRSDNKGPEPEGVTIGSINYKYYAFITLERIGGFMAYDISSPLSPEFVDYKNNRNTATASGDLGPEGIIYINPYDSPVDTGLVVIANEISATVSVYYIKNDLKRDRVPLSNWAIAIMAGLIIAFTAIRSRRIGI
jgi:hypothetical protein